MTVCDVAALIPDAAVACKSQVVELHERTTLFLFFKVKEVRLGRVAPVDWLKFPTDPVDPIFANELTTPLTVVMVEALFVLT
jgi:hypothetical protein